MALWVCGGEAGCGTKYAVGLFRCPRCHNREFFEDGDPMAKISRYGGASDKTLPVPEPEAEQDDAVESPADVVSEPEEEAPVIAPEPEEGGEESSPGSSSSASTETPPTNSEPSSKPRQRRARKTANPSAKDQTESGSAPSTDGEKTDGTSAADEH